MNNPKVESLEKLLDLIDKLCIQEENQWFKEKLVEKFSKSPGFENFPEFLKYQKKQFKIKGRYFYEKIKDEKLKLELINDFIEMSWYQSINNVNRFALSTYCQMENLLNFYSIKSNAFEKIFANKNYYTIKYTDKFTVESLKSYFYYPYDKNTFKSIEKVNIWAKITYWVLDSKIKMTDWEKDYHSSTSNLINIRNITTHRSSISKNDSTKNTIAYLKKADLSSLGFYINILKEIVGTLKDIDPTVKIHDINLEKPKIKAPKIVGKIDLDK